jgi:hypothetical protein
VKRWLARSVPLMAAVTLSSCMAQPAKSPAAGAKTDLVSPFSSASEADQTRDSEDALKAYLSLLDTAVDAPGAPHALAAILASVSALTSRNVGGIERVGGHLALAYRHPGAMKTVLAGLAKAYDRADFSGPFARGAIARGAYALASYQGDAVAADLWRTRTGCAREATVIGPLEWPPITAIERATPVEAPTSKLGESYPGIAPFAARLRPTVVHADGCDIGLYESSVLDGVRAVVIDVAVPRSQKIGVVLESSSAAVVIVGGTVAMRRGFFLGGGRVQTIGSAQVDKGLVRIVARVASNGEDQQIALNCFAEDGSPLVARAPLPGQAATVHATSASETTLVSATITDAEQPMIASGLLALGDARSAEHLIEDRARSHGAAPIAALIYARAIDQAGDLPEVRAIERSRVAYETALSVWPASWEAVVGHAQLTARRRGTGEGRIEALGEIARARTAQRSLHPAVSAAEAAMAAEGGLFDIAERAFAEAQKAAPGTPLLAWLDTLVHDEVGTERERQACRTADTDRGSLMCLGAKAGRGDRRGALAEIARLRALRGSPSALRSHEIEQYLALDDREAVTRLFDAMPPAERTLSSIGLLAGRSPVEARTRLLGSILSASDSPGSVGPLLGALGQSPAADLEAEGAEIVAADRKTRVMSDAATAVLKHTERYLVGDGGLVHYVLYDLRRVSGTTDVEQGAQSAGAMIEGRDARRVLRRRIHKTDGRVLEPDLASYASQGHADLAQLEKGDYIEEIVEGWALPGASGQIVVDTPDLLPERTSVKDATIELRRAASLPLQLWAHGLLGKPAERLDGDQKVTVWKMHDQLPRSLEEGVPKMDRDVAVSFGTSSWTIIGRSIAEQIALLDDRDPFVARWARDAARSEKEAGGAANPPTRRDVIDRIAAAAGRAVKVANGSILSDSAAALSGGRQSTTARTILELGQGSRTWISQRALKELGFDAEIVVAESEPFSASPDFPAHFGRFDYPLLVVHVDGEDVWLDLDVRGPPLPAGHVSPELRGRFAMGANGTIRPVAGALAEDARDEVDIRVKLDDKGNAAGSFTILLRGRTAQALADALERVVGADRRDMLRNVVLGWLPWANVNDVALSSSEGSWQVSLRAVISIPGYAQQEGGAWVLPGLEPLHSVFPHGAVSTIGARFASRGSRQSALAIDDAIQYHVHRRVELSPSAALRASPASIEVKADYIQAARKSRIASGSLEEDFSLSIPTGTLDTARYKDFSADARRIDDAFLAATRVAR